MAMAPYLSTIDVVEATSGRAMACAGNVCLNEALPNPNGYDDAAWPGGEWMEIHNSGSTAVNVLNWQLENKASKTLDFDTNQNFILTLGSGANTLANPTTEAGNVGQTGVMIFIQPSSGSAGTVSLGTDYESVGGAGLTLSSANSAYDVVPYIIKADNSILLGTPQLAFS